MTVRELIDRLENVAAVGGGNMPVAVITGSIEDDGPEGCGFGTFVLGPDPGTGLTRAVFFLDLTAQPGDGDRATLGMMHTG